MLHGNLLLRGWWLSDVSFYTTELPEYMLVELARGLNPGVINVAGAATYTLLVALAARLAKGRATGTEGLLRALIAAGIMLAPGPGFSAASLLSSPDHIGTQVPLLLIWLADRQARRPLVPALAGRGVLLDLGRDRRPDSRIRRGPAGHRGLRHPDLPATRVLADRRGPAGRSGGLGRAGDGRYARASVTSAALPWPRSRDLHHGGADTASCLADAPVGADAVRRGLHRAAVRACRGGGHVAPGRRDPGGVGRWPRGQAAAGADERLVPMLLVGIAVNLAAYLFSTQASISDRRMNSPRCSRSARCSQACSARHPAGR